MKMSAKMWPICRSINVFKLDVNYTGELHCIKKLFYEVCLAENIHVMTGTVVF